MSETWPMRTYSQDEVDAIFERAINDQAKEQTELSHDELVNAASEVGISRDAIDAAIRDLSAKQNVDASRKSDKDIVRTHARRTRVGFARHFVVYVLVIALLAFMNLAATPHFWWFLIVALGWGIGIAMHLMSALFIDEERVIEHAREREIRKMRRQKWKKRGAEFENSVNEGVRLLLESAQKKNARIVVTPHENKPRVELREELDDDEEDSHAKKLKMP